MVATELPSEGASLVRRACRPTADLEFRPFHLDFAPAPQLAKLLPLSDELLIGIDRRSGIFHLIRAADGTGLDRTHLQAQYGLNSLRQAVLRGTPAGFELVTAWEHPHTGVGLVLSVSQRADPFQYVVSDGAGRIRAARRSE